MNRIKLILFALIAGFAGMFILWTAAFLVIPKLAAIVYLYPGIELIPIIGIIASKTIYILFPSGGLESTAGFVALIAALFWWLLGTICAYFALRIKS